MYYAKYKEYKTKYLNRVENSPPSTVKVSGVFHCSEYVRRTSENPHQRLLLMYDNHRNANYCPGEDIDFLDSYVHKYVPRVGWVVWVEEPPSGCRSNIQPMWDASHTTALSAWAWREREGTSADGRYEVVPEPIDKRSCASSSFNLPSKKYTSLISDVQTHINNNKTRVSQKQSNALLVSFSLLHWKQVLELSEDPVQQLENWKMEGDVLTKIMGETSKNIILHMGAVHVSAIEEWLESGTDWVQSGNRKRLHPDRWEQHLNCASVPNLRTSI